MLIKVNETQKEISSNLTVKELVGELKISDNGIAIAINNSVVKKDDWINHKLQSNDNVLIIRSTQGG
ncbi:sulfur carrier protein ThiS [Tenacibaculum sp. MAR_2009_124]|uniref:sulfur carrier protein ThiS n=1 Tax=Tenacibaculum sp. MAR_2009_124 TaxID=1250059 RepID=UPI00089C1A7C|nr:sulfur carrier protein ThiS [Tenacibaculum sp. MAR_2009_124]SEB79805.1 sulfur carrier protein ThiS [Tenacibaculum sp. MAR_2009_124]